ncbi:MULTISPECIES: inositol monophosphatase family protein [unclassified Streptomyces]|uniref:inositol monophosphatase family protein n=1 Tax=unclassified Streptomyces TaxID=2593676 RepID=UPI003702FD31
MTSDFHELFRIGSEAVDQAVSVVREMAVGQIMSKGDRDMVSALDLAVEDRVRSFLRQETPEIGFLGEERGGERFHGTDLTWALDPVDGTANLVHGIPLCGVSLGLVQGQRSIMGIIDLPFLHHRFHALDGHGAYRGTTRLKASTASSLAASIVALGDYAVGEEAEERNRLRLAVTRLLAKRALRVRMLGSAAVDLSWVASGQVDATIALSNHPWDMAAGVCIAREAGCAVMDASGEPHTVTSSATITAAPELREAILKVLHDSQRLRDGDKLEQG